MRKIGVWILLFVLAISFVLAADTTAPSIPGGIDDESLDATQKAIDDYSPLNKSGEVDFKKYQPFKTKAEQRIEGINEWLDDNVSWMRYIFWMKPQISGLFIFNVYFILLFLTILVFNAQGLWFFIEKKSSAMLFGLAVFVVFSVARLYVGLANVANLWWTYVWDILIPSSIWLGIILIILTAVLAIFFFPLVLAILRMVAKYLESKRQFKEKAKMKASSEAVNKLVDQIK